MHPWKVLEKKKGCSWAESFFSRKVRNIFLVGRWENYSVDSGPNFDHKKYWENWERPKEWKERLLKQQLLLAEKSP